MKIQPEEKQAKQPYETPALKKLGTVQEVTQGVNIVNQPDDSAFSI